MNSVPLVELSPRRHGSWMAPSPRRLAQGGTLAAPGRHEMVQVRRREGRLGSEHSDLPVVLESPAAHRFAAGIGAFVANTEYAHGGISPQECVIPELIVEHGEAAIVATITGINWRGTRCRVAVETNTAALQVDLRLNWKQAASSIAATAKEPGANGEASLAVSDDKHEGAAASVVVSDSSGGVLDYKPTTVGEGA